jgi:hypothetical protein
LNGPNATRLDKDGRKELIATHALTRLGKKLEGIHKKREKDRSRVVDYPIQKSGRRSRSKLKLLFQLSKGIKTQICNPFRFTANSLSL